MSGYDPVSTPQKKDNSSPNQSKQVPISIQNSSCPANIIQRLRMHPQTFSPTDAMILQKTIGNRSVCQLMREIGLMNSQPGQRETLPEEEELLQGKFDTLQRKVVPEEEKEPVQKKRENQTGLPDDLKAGVENLSGLSMDDVKVHYNSDKPAQVGALAFIQGMDIHVAPGQERHLPHEAWHLVQQAQGRVRPTLQLKGVAVNDDAGLEREADIYGELAISAKTVETGKDKTHSARRNSNDTIQRKGDIKVRSTTPYIEDEGNFDSKGFKKRKEFIGDIEKLKKVSAAKSNEYFKEYAEAKLKELKVKQEKQEQEVKELREGAGILLGSEESEGRIIKENIRVCYEKIKRIEKNIADTEGRIKFLSGKSIDGRELERTYFINGIPDIGILNTYFLKAIKQLLIKNAPEKEIYYIYNQVRKTITVMEKSSKKSPEFCRSWLDLNDFCNEIIDLIYTKPIVPVIVEVFGNNSGQLINIMKGLSKAAKGSTAIIVGINTAPYDENGDKSEIKQIQEVTQRAEQINSAFKELKLMGKLIAFTYTVDKKQSYDLPYFQVRSLLMQESAYFVDLFSKSDMGNPIIRVMDRDVTNDPLLTGKIGKDNWKKIGEIADRGADILDGGYNWDTSSNPYLIGKINESEMQFRSFLYEKNHNLIYYPEPNMYMGVDAQTAAIKNLDRASKSVKPEEVEMSEAVHMVKDAPIKFFVDMPTSKPVKEGYLGNLSEIIAKISTKTVDIKDVNKMFNNIRQSHLADGFFGQLKSMTKRDLILEQGIAEIIEAKRQEIFASLVSDLNK